MADERDGKPAAAEDDFGNVPDPDEDDLDDLDDMLSDFAAAKIDAPNPNATPSAPGRSPAPPAAAAAPSPSVAEAPPPAGPAGASAKAAEPAPPASPEDLLSDEEFTKQLQAGMADLLGEMEGPGMQAEMQNFLKELQGITGNLPAGTDGAAPTAGASASSAAGARPTSSASTAAGEASFQDTIRRTMERMQASGEQATAAAADDAAGDGTDAFVAELLRQMQGGLAGEGGGGDGNPEAAFTTMLQGMMEQLTNKEILYEPMRELNERFPEWMAENGAKTSADDLRRYEEQMSIVREIVARFEDPAYSDANKQDREFIVERMQKMQAAGSPPPDLVGDIPSAQEALGMPEESCNPQ